MVYGMLKFRSPQELHSCILSKNGLWGAKISLTPLFYFLQTFVDADLTVPKDLEGAVEKPYKDYKVRTNIPFHILVPKCITLCNRNGT